MRVRKIESQDYIRAYLQANEFYYATVFYVWDFGGMDIPKNSAQFNFKYDRKIFGNPIDFDVRYVIVDYEDEEEYEAFATDVKRSELEVYATFWKNYDVEDEA